eukprot:CAMPEP_0116144626 /NCGR_PEP_ID=MMETSP0329-20121206/16110_1 /TAXON_ID=697910 /ORGANISM="Pseudo-nitzschia arenysensis, Strain B593" /LENGTH=429 /DNA_ID=CAMNT_0003640077 /DNA_START=242 /DNA_END=1528 /DNA_ORIENTATION=-
MASNCAELSAVMGDMSIVDEKKEERVVVSCQEENCHPQTNSLPQHLVKPFNGCTIEENPLSNDAAEEEELKELRKRLDHLRRRRRRIQESTKIDCVNQRELLLRRLNSKRRDRSEIIDEYLSAWKGRDSINLFLDCSKRWNVLNDCFPIWIDGKSGFATINGCRLGAEAPSLPNDLLIATRSETKISGKWVISGNTNGNQPNEISPPKRSILGLFGNNNNNEGANPNNDSDKGHTISEPIRVPILEINAALGHACLLLKVLQESSSKRGSQGMKFTHELHPMGATSKIGIRFGNSGVLATAAGILSNSSSDANSFTTAPVVYNLFMEENSGFSFFKKNARNFNWALQAFLQCIAEAAAQQADKTIAIPHAIQHKKTFNSSSVDNRANHLGGGEWTIGGLSICYPSQQQQQQQNGEAKNGLASNSAALEW